MSGELSILIATSASIAFFHTLLGPDHYLPFIIMSKARKWSIVKTLWITFFCGLGHVGSSVVLGIIGVALGIGLSKIVDIESIRGGIAAWAFIIFGLGYFIFGLWRVFQNKPHKHMHAHANGNIHLHSHKHENEHDHTHNKNITPWILFTIFVLGPCEPLIPILMYPSAQNSIGGLIIVTLIFTVITISTMLIVVFLASYGINILPFGKLEKYTHAIAGATILLSGIAIVFWEL